MANESGSTAITSCEDTDRTVFRRNRYSNNWLSRAPARVGQHERYCIGKHNPVKKSSLDNVEGGTGARLTQAQELLAERPDLLQRLRLGR